MKILIFTEGTIMKEDLIKQLRASRKRLLNILSKLPNEGIFVGKWSKKEILAHLAGWQEEGAVCIPLVLKGEKPKSFRMPINKYNEESVAKRKNKNISEILNELSQLTESFIKQVSQLSDEQIKGFYGTKLGKKPINVLWIIYMEISHDNNHAKELEKLFG